MRAVVDKRPWPLAEIRVTFRRAASDIAYYDIHPEERPGLAMEAFNDALKATLRTLPDPTAWTLKDAALEADQLVLTLVPIRTTEEAAGG